MIKNYSIQINAPIDKAFAAVDEESKIQKWMNGKLETQYISLKDKENPVGTKFHQEIAGIGNLGKESEIIAYEKPRLLGVGGTSTLATTTLFYRFESIGENLTQLNCELEIASSNKLKEAIVASLVPLINRLMRSQLKSIKKLAEE